MITVHFNHRVKDFEKWLPFFKEDSSNRKAAGCKSAKVLTDPNDRNNVTVVLTWDDSEAAFKYGNLSGVKDKMKQAGVISEPTITIFNNEAEMAG